MRSTSCQRSSDSSSGRRIDVSQPFVDAMLPEGHRLHVVLEGISRGAQDEYAAESYRRALAAQKEGCFAGEIVAVAGFTWLTLQRPLLALVTSRPPEARERSTVAPLGVSGPRPVSQK